MRAIIYTRYGPPEVLRLAERPTPQPRTRELLIRVRAAEATKADCEMRSFRFAVLWFWLPLRIAFGITRPKRHILGGYFSGEVVAVGPGVTTTRIRISPERDRPTTSSSTWWRAAPTGAAWPRSDRADGI